MREDIDNTVRLELAYDQNTFSLEAVSINYDYPSNILYSWKLEGLYEEPSGPERADTVHEPAPRQLHPAYPCRLQ